MNATLENETGRDSVDCLVGLFPRVKINLKKFKINVDRIKSAT
jgi:hypothetical protein